MSHLIAPPDPSSLGEKLRGALQGIAVGDATAVHADYYTNKRQLARDYPDGSVYMTPLQSHPNSPVARSAAPRGTDRRVQVGAAVYCAAYSC
jgi:hypothetical protein